MSADRPLLLVALLLTLAQLYQQVQHGWRPHWPRMGQLMGLTVLYGWLMGRQAWPAAEAVALGLGVIFVLGPIGLARQQVKALRRGDLVASMFFSRLLWILTWSPGDLLQLRLIRGLRVLVSGDIERAQIMFSETLQQVTNPVQRMAAVDQLVQLLVDKQDWKSAILVYEASSPKDDEVGELLAYAMVRAYCQVADLSHGMACQQVLEQPGAEALELALLGRVCLAARFGTPAMVVSLFEKQRDILGRYEAVLEPYWIAIAHENNGDYQAAIPWFEMARGRAQRVDESLARKIAGAHAAALESHQAGRVAHPRPAQEVQAIAVFLQGLQPIRPAAPTRIFDQGPPRVTQALLLVNVLVYVLTVWPELWRYVGVDGPLGVARHRVLIVYGALVKWMVLDGQYWRLVGAQFLHADLLHIIFNGYALHMLGGIVERLYGRSKMLVLYLLSGLAGSGLSLMTGSYDLSVGASGAICGLLGLAIAACMRKDSTLPDAMRRNILRQLVMMAVMVLGMGFLFPAIDNAGHIGGGVAGFALGWLAYPESYRERTPVHVQVAMALGIALMLGIVIWSFWMIGRNVVEGGYPRRLPPMQGRRIPGTEVDVQVPRFWVPLSEKQEQGRLAYGEPMRYMSCWMLVTIRKEDPLDVLSNQLRASLKAQGIGEDLFQLHGWVDGERAIVVVFVVKEPDLYRELIQRILDSIPGRR